MVNVVGFLDTYEELRRKHLARLQRLHDAKSEEEIEAEAEKKQREQLENVECVTTIVLAENEDAGKNHNPEKEIKLPTKVECKDAVGNNNIDTYII